MPRWEPQARERLIRAALELYAKQGYDATTIDDIATHARVTSRTFFRHFPDKREVLFGNADAIRERIASSLAGTDPDLAPLDAALHAIKTCDELFVSHKHDELRRRDALIQSSSELQEREARKLADIAADIAEQLLARGTPADVAHLAADLGVAVFKHAARLWTSNPAVSFSARLDQAAGQARDALAIVNSKKRPSTVEKRPTRHRARASK